MKRWKNPLGRTVATTLIGLTLALSAQAQSPYRKDVVQAAQSAQEALKGNRAAEALTTLEPARKLTDLNDDERLLLDRLAAVASLQSQNPKVAIDALEALLRNPKLPVAERPTYLDSLVSAAIKASDYPRVERAARECLAAGCPTDRLRLTLLQSLNLQGRHADVVREVQPLLADPQKAATLNEAQLRVLGASQLALKDGAGYVATLVALLERHPTPDYWGDLLLRLPSQPGFNPRLELDVFRLLMATGNLQEAPEFLEMANLATKAGLPLETAYVLTQAQARGLAKDAATDRLLQQARKKAAEDEQALPQMAKAAKDAAAWSGVGLVRFSARQWEGAAEAFAKAFEAGTPRHPDESRLHQGIALAMAGKKEAARDTLAQVGGDAKLLARLWTLRLNETR